MILFVLFWGGLLIFFIKSVKTGSRLLSVTLPLHKSRSGSVRSTDVCERGRERSLEVRSVRSARKPKYTVAQAESRSASSCDAFYLSTGEKPDSINVSLKSQEVIRFCFSKRNIFQPRLDSGNNFLLCCKTFSRRYPRSLEQLHTCMVFSRFFTEKVTNNAGPKFMCLSSSLFVTYFLAVYQKPTNVLYFPLSIMSILLVSLRKVKPYPFPRQTKLICDSECVTRPLWIHSNRLTLSVFHEQLTTICKTEKRLHFLLISSSIPLKSFTLKRTRP